jgi:hypothetical protein
MLAILAVPFILAGVVLFLLGIIAFILLVTCIAVPALILSVPVGAYIVLKAWWQASKEVQHYADTEAQIERMVDDVFREGR